MGVPGSRCASSAVMYLHESHAAFDKPPCGQQLFAELASLFLPQPVQLVGLGRLFGKVQSFWYRTLHTECQLISLNVSSQRCIARFLLRNRSRRSINSNPTRCSWNDRMISGVP